MLGYLPRTKKTDDQRYFITAVYSGDPCTKVTVNGTRVTLVALT